MTRVVIIEPTPPAKCAFCGVVEELRPYGPKRERICFKCAMKDKKTTAHVFREDILGEGVGNA